MKKNNRRVGQIRQAPSSIDNIPHTIKDLSINNVNIHSQMKAFDQSRENIFDKYEQIIKDLQNVIKDLVDKNNFINEQRLRLISQNFQLKQQINSMQQTYNSLNKFGSIALFEVFNEEQSIAVTYSRVKNNKNYIDEQHQSFEIQHSSHHYQQQISADLSISGRDQQKTPCLVQHNSMVQCKANSNEAPLRIFYLMLLQQKYFIKKMKDLLDLSIEDQQKILFPMYPKGNLIFAKLLHSFLDSIVEGAFEEEIQLINYLCTNPLIDLLFISLLRFHLPLDNEDSQLNVGKWCSQSIDHKIFFQGLANEFDLIMDINPTEMNLKFYYNPPCKTSRIQNSSVSEQNLLESEQNIQQVSLFANQNMVRSQITQLRHNPRFTIFVDLQNQYYRANISIRPDNYQSSQSSNVIEESFHQTNQDNENEYSEYGDENIQFENMVLRQRNLNIYEKQRNISTESHSLIKKSFKELSARSSYIRVASQKNY